MDAGALFNVPQPHSGVKAGRGEHLRIEWFPSDREPPESFFVQEKGKPLFLPGSCLDSVCPGLWGSILWCRSPFDEPRTRQWLQFNCLKDDNSNSQELDTRTDELHQNVLSGTTVIVKKPEGHVHSHLSPWSTP